MNRIAIMQPTYLPWLGYFDLIEQVDKFVFMDNVQLVKRSWQVRNRIKTSQEELFLTISIKKTKKRDETLICDALIDQENQWKEKHIKSIEFAYQKAPFFDCVFPFIKNLIFRDEHLLSKFNIYIIRQIAIKLGIKTDLITASELKNIQGSKDLLLVSMCQEVGCNEYLSPKAASVYIDKDYPGGELVRNNIQVYYHNYEHPLYNQIHGKFIPFLSIIDLLFNHGFENSLAIVRQGRRESIGYLNPCKEYE